MAGHSRAPLEYRARYPQHLSQRARRNGVCGLDSLAGLHCVKRDVSLENGETPWTRFPETRGTVQVPLCVLDCLLGHLGLCNGLCPCYAVLVHRVRNRAGYSVWAGGTHSDGRDASFGRGSCGSVAPTRQEERLAKARLWRRRVRRLAQDGEEIRPEAGKERAPQQSDPEQFRYGKPSKRRERGTAADALEDGRLESRRLTHAGFCSTGIKTVVGLEDVLARPGFEAGHQPAFQDIGQQPGAENCPM